MTARPSLAVLVLTELRKTADTRSGRWLHVAVGAAMHLALAYHLTVGGKYDRTLASTLVEIHTWPPLLALLGVLVVTAEWGHRTTVVTFCLVPDRERVILGKAIAAVLMTLAWVLVSLIVAVAGYAAGTVTGRTAGDWSLPPALVGQVTVIELGHVLCGFALGLALLRTLPATVTYLVAPQVVMVAAVTAGERMADSVPWIALPYSLYQLADPDVSGQTWIKVATAAALWVLLPLLVGIARVRRAEIA